MTTEFQWPIAATPSAWSVGGFWLPSQADETQPASTLFEVVDTDDTVIASLTYDSTADTLVGAVGATEVESDVLDFAANQPIGFALRFDTTSGVALTVAGNHYTDPSTDPGTDEAAFERLTLGAINGVLDELVIFAGRLSDAQAEAVGGAATQLADMPTDPRPVWYAAFDSDLEPAGAGVATGRRRETAADNSLYRFVASLQDVADHAPFGLESDDPTTLIEFAAGLVTETTEDTAADVHDQFAGASHQETRVR